MPSSAIEIANIIASVVYETKQSSVGAWVSVCAFIDSKLHGKAYR